MEGETTVQGYINAVIQHYLDMGQKMSPEASKLTIREKYEACERMDRYLLYIITKAEYGRSCFRKDPLEFRYSRNDSEEKLSSESREKLKEFINEPHEDFTVALTGTSSHAQFIFFDHVNKTFIIIDPQINEEQSVGKEIETLTGYRYDLYSACPKGPQGITDDSFCAMWTLLILSLICSLATALNISKISFPGYHLIDSVYQILLIRPDRNLIVINFINFCYSHLEEAGLLPVAKRLVMLREQLDRKEIVENETCGSVDILNDANILAIENSVEEFIHNRIKSCYDRNPIYDEIKATYPMITDPALQLMLIFRSVLDRYSFRNISDPIYQRVLLRLEIFKDVPLDFKIVDKAIKGAIGSEMIKITRTNEFIEDPTLIEIYGTFEDKFNDELKDYVNTVRSDILAKPVGERTGEEKYMLRTLKRY